MRHHLALAALFALSGSIAHAAPTKKKKPVVTQEADGEDESEKDEEANKPRATKRKASTDDDEAPRVRKASSDHPNRKEKEENENENENEKEKDEAPRAAKRKSAVRSDDDDVAIDAPVRVRRAARPRANAWNAAIGPYLWASSVDANVSIGPANVSSGIDFLDMQKHAKYGVPLQGEARYGRFSVYADMIYAVVGLDGANTVGPVMVAVDGTISSLMADGFAGYLLYGDDQSLLSLEGRVGVRYQRTAISARLELAGAPLTPPEYIDASSDGLVGGRVVLRPSRRFNLSSTFDLGVFGASNSTWSALVDANVRLGSRVNLSLGWKTMTTDKANVSLVMHGPRAAVQLLF